jgi:hypothetical protein
MPNRYHRRVSDSRAPRGPRSTGRKVSRRGRDMRGPLLPPTVPGWRSRAERFDMAVLEAYEPIERRWQDRLSGLDVAVDEIPRISAKDPHNVQWPPEVVADGPIALARLIAAGVDVRGSATRARVVLFRKPIERRAKDTVELAELLHEILVAQVATYLDVEPSVIDPTIEDEEGATASEIIAPPAVPPLFDNPSRSDDSALQASPLALGKPTPYTEALVVPESVFQAFASNLTAQADLLRLASGAALLGKKRLWIRLCAQRSVLPLIGCFLVAYELVLDGVGNQTQMGPLRYPCQRQTKSGVRCPSH